MGSCGDAFDYPDWQIIDDKQSDTSGGDGIDMGDVSDEVLEGELRQAMEYVIDFREHKYQYQRNTNIDVFAGYCTVSKVNSTLANLYIIRMIIRMGIMVVLSVRVRNYFRNFITLIFCRKSWKSRMESNRSNFVCLQYA